MTTNALIPRGPTMAMGTLEDPEKLGRLLAASGYFTDARDAAQAVVKVLAGAELGFGPIASMTGIYIVKGRVTLSANLMAAAIKRHPRYDYRIKERTNERAVVEFWEDGRALGTSEFGMDDARRAGLAGGENWKKYPGNMLLWRAMSNGAKFYCPDAFSGAPIYTPDELGAEVDPETGELNALVIDGATGEVLNGNESEPASVRAPASASDAGRASATDAERPADDTAASPLPSSVAPPEPEPPASAPPAAEPASDPEPEGDPTEPVTPEDVAAFRELAAARGVPEAHWRMALITFRAGALEDLSKGQLADITAKVHDRFPA